MLKRLELRDNGSIALRSCLSYSLEFPLIWLQVCRKPPSQCTMIKPPSSPPRPFSQNLNLRHIRPITLNQLVKVPRLHSAQRERAFPRRPEHALHFIALAFLISDPTQHHLILFPSSFLIQHTEEFAFKVYLVGLVLQPRCDLRGGFADEGGFEGRGERSLGGFLAAAFGLSLRGCLEEEG